MATTIQRKVSNFNSRIATPSSTNALNQNLQHHQQQRRRLQSSYSSSSPFSSKFNYSTTHINIFTIIILVLITTSTIPSAIAELEFEYLAVKPHKQSAEVDTFAIFTCTDENGVVDTRDIQWRFKRAPPLSAIDIMNTDDSANTTTNNSTDSDEDRFVNVNGTLTIRSLTLNDTGEYECLVIDRQGNGGVPKNQTVKLIVYVMPDYTQYTIEVVVVACTMFAILIIGQILKMRTEAAKKKKEAELKNRKRRRVKDNNNSNTQAKPITTVGDNTSNTKL